ncbi:MAG: DUF4249 family protein [Bacteroidia bacterium]|nr:DUF4249 family protein [Bacteroidia bacterium]MCZ2249434.1 DUF4249 domain-containing protein [Bacteroidia bacterium]
MKKAVFSFVSLIMLAMLLSACEDRIDLSLEEGESQLTVDGFITFYLDSEALNSGIEKQMIKLRKTSGYFNNAPAPPALGATVQVTDALGRTFNFIDIHNTGNYEYSGPFEISLTNPPMGFPGNFYKLYIKYNGEEYNAMAYMDSVPKIDSLKFVHRDAAILGSDTLKAGYIIEQIFTRQSDGSLTPTKDIKGEGTCYWFKTFKNDVFYNNPFDMNLAYDASYGPGSDHVAFIPMVVYALNPERFNKGDKVRIECWSIGLPSYYFLNMARLQMTNEGMFASPASNVPTNIVNADKDSKAKAVGWFGAASISRITQEVKE